MTTTPPLSRSRANTPPTPLHGPKFDAYEPYSPRRSARQAIQQSALLPYPSIVKHAGLMLARDIAQQTILSQVPSPPSSPTTPQASKTRDSEDLFVQHSQSKMESEGSDADMLQPFPPTTLAASTAFPNMLPTPTKTPRKRDAKYEKRLSSTARVLFPGRSANIEDRMPALRKPRHSNRSSAFSLDSPQAGSSIGIYTDSKDRIPDVEAAEENPFLAPRNKRSYTSRSAADKRSKHGMSAEIDKAVEDGEGMVYTFRGKKVYRKFSAAASDHDALDDIEGEALLRRAGEAARRPLTRSPITPRLLFPPKSPSPAANISDEEALTDIEQGVVPETDSDGDYDGYEARRPKDSVVHSAETKSGQWRLPHIDEISASNLMRDDSPAKRRTPSLGVRGPPLPRDHFAESHLSVHATSSVESASFVSGSLNNRATTPVRQQTRLVTPPTTIRKNKPQRGKKLTPADFSPLIPEVEFAPLPSVVRRLDEQRQASPFDEWTRTKPGTRSASAKRSGETMLSGEAKRTRSDDVHRG